MLEIQVHDPNHESDSLTLLHVHSYFQANFWSVKESLIRIHTIPQKVLGFNQWPFSNNHRKLCWKILKEI